MAPAAQDAARSPVERDVAPSGSCSASTPTRGAGGHDPFEHERPAAITDPILAASVLYVGGDSPGWTGSASLDIDRALAATYPILLPDGLFPWGSDPTPPDPSNLKGTRGTSCGAMS